MKMPKDDVIETIHELATYCLKQAKSDLRKATQLMETAVHENSEFRRLLTDPLIRTACYDHLRSVCRAKRGYIWFSENWEESGNGGRLLSAGRTLLDFPLPGGKPFRDATKEEIQGAAEFYEIQATTLGARGAWLRAASQKMKTGQKGGEVWTHNKLLALQHKIAPPMV
jgi:hypothetical protein